MSSRPAAHVAILLLAAASPVLAGPPERQYQVMRFEEDWSWLATSPPAKADPFDAVKNVHAGGDWWFLLGGSVRLRFERDDNRPLGASPVETDGVMPFRTFLHWELRHAKDFRWFAELRYSDLWDADRPVGLVWHDDPDVQNFFVEGTLGSSTKHPVSLRAGRQELLFGNEKLVSPLNWSNTRRTWDGVSIIAKTPHVRTQVFATRPVLHEPHDLDSADDNVSFSGVTTRWKPKDGQVLEGSWWLLHDGNGKYVSERSGATGDVDRHSFGAWYSWKQGGWSGDVEACLQRGEAADDDISAFMGTLTAGYQWAKTPGKPRAFAGWDIATGNASPSDGKAGTFDQLYALGHMYMGHVDVVGRRNIEDLRLGFEAWPAKGRKIEMTWHRFSLEESRDGLYDATGKLTRKDPTGAAGSDVGDELDVMFTWTWATHHWAGVEVGRFWSGDFIDRTGSGDDATLLWAGYELRF
jgi:hypothetical protein